MSFAVGDIILNGKYRLYMHLGQGAFGDVYRAVHVELRAPRALKVLRHDAPGVGSSDYVRARERFMLEAQLGAALERAEHVIHVHDFEEEDGALVLVMEYAPGGNLSDRLSALRQRGVGMAVGDVVRISREIALGLAALHELDAVHRDVKPSNILFDDKGRARLADFGLTQVPGGVSRRSQTSRPGRHPGTPQYMSPEQRASDDHLTPASDVYALGALMFEMLTERVWRSARPGTTPQELCHDVPGWLDALVMHCLADLPEDRPWDGAAVVRLLEQGLEEEAAQTERAAGLPAANERRGRIGSALVGWLAVGIVLALLVWGGSGGASLFALQSTPVPTTQLTPMPQPTAAFAVPRVGIVSGHMGNDSGAICPDGLTEAKINRDIAERVVDLLEGHGWQVDLLDEFDVRLNGYQADALLSIHADSCNVPGKGAFKVARVESRYVPSEEDWLVDCIADRYARVTGLNFDRHTITYDMTRYHAYYEIDPDTPAAVIEVGSMLDDRAMLTEQADLVAEGIVAGLDCYISGNSP